MKTATSPLVRVYIVLCTKALSHLQGVTEEMLSVLNVLVPISISTLLNACHGLMARERASATVKIILPTLGQMLFPLLLPSMLYSHVPISFI